VLATEAAVEAVADRLTERTGRAAVAPTSVAAAIAAKERSLGRSLTEGQRQAAVAITTSGRGLDLVVGVAGSGKTTALDLARAAFEAEGYRVVGTAISGQAARALHDEAGIDSRTIASLVWRLEHGTLGLDERTALRVDEAGMADDQALLKLLAAVDVARAKAVVTAITGSSAPSTPAADSKHSNRHGPAVHMLDENVRQRLPGERRALEQLRAGTVAEAVDLVSPARPPGHHPDPRRRDHSRRRCVGGGPAGEPTDRAPRLAPPRRRRAQRASPATMRGGRPRRRPRAASARRQVLRVRRPSRHPRSGERRPIRDQRAGDRHQGWL